MSFLTDWPEIGRRGRRGYRELVVSRSRYVVLYRVSKKAVIIVRVRHSSQKR